MVWWWLHTILFSSGDHSLETLFQVRLLHGCWHILININTLALQASLCHRLQIFKSIRRIGSEIYHRFYHTSSQTGSYFHRSLDQFQGNICNHLLDRWYGINQKAVDMLIDLLSNLTHHNFKLIGSIITILTLLMRPVGGWQRSLLSIDKHAPRLHTPRVREVRDTPFKQNLKGGQDNFILHALRSWASSLGSINSTHSGTLDLMPEWRLPVLDYCFDDLNQMHA